MSGPGTLGTHSGFPEGRTVWAHNAFFARGRIQQVTDTTHENLDSTRAIPIPFEACFQNNWRALDKKHSLLQGRRLIRTVLFCLSLNYNLRDYFHTNSKHTHATNSKHTQAPDSKHTYVTNSKHTHGATAITATLCSLTDATPGIHFQETSKKMLTRLRKSVLRRLQFIRFSNAGFLIFASSMNRQPANG